jgi:hypothetical protein
MTTPETARLEAAIRAVLERPCLYWDEPPVIGDALVADGDYVAAVEAVYAAGHAQGEDDLESYLRYELAKRKGGKK